MALTFGLLHGFGFAGALTEVGLPEQAIPLALLFFNVGVEVGQLLFIAAVVLLTAAARRLPLPQAAWARPALGVADPGLRHRLGRRVLDPRADRRILELRCSGSRNAGPRNA